MKSRTIEDISKEIEICSDWLDHYTNKVEYYTKFIKELEQELKEKGDDKKIYVV